MAAQLYAGPESFITGLAALRYHGIRGPYGASVDVLIPERRQRASCGFVVIHRTRRMPAYWNQDSETRYTCQPARSRIPCAGGET